MTFRSSFVTCFLLATITPVAAANPKLLNVRGMDRGGRR